MRAISRSRCNGVLVRRLIPQRLALRFELAELDEKKIVFAQREGELLRVQPSKFEQLFVGQQMPVALDDGDVRARLLITRDARRIAQAHRARPVRTMSAGFAPTTRAMRSGVTNGQLRHTKACRRLGKCGNETGLGAGPLGRSATAMADDFPASLRQRRPDESSQRQSRRPPQNWL